VLVLVINLLSFLFYFILEIFGVFARASANDGLVSISESMGNNIATSHSYSSIDYAQRYALEDGDLIGNAKLHYLQDSNWATNFGMGFRHPMENYDLELNLFYDALIDKDVHHQLGIGGGVLTNAFEARCNIYLPIGSKTHTVKSVRFDYPDGYRADCFQKRIDLSGMDLECGRLFDRLGPFQIFGAIGGYGYRAKHIDNIYGVRTRLNCDFWNKLKADLIVTHDKVFKTSVQFSVSLYFPFGDCQTASFWNFLNIRRQELIVRDPKCCAWKTNY
jgi:hypothetical protein